MFNDITWKESEQKVQEYMKKRGYKILLTNFSCVGVELDIVAILSKSAQKNILKEQTKQRILEDKKNKSIYKNSLKNALKQLDDLLVITEVKGRETDKFGLGVCLLNKYMLCGADYPQYLLAQRDSFQMPENKVML